MHDETFNYSVIKLIVRIFPYATSHTFHNSFQIALNEQFMVADLKVDDPAGQSKPNGNGVIRVLMRRLGLSKTFGENMIFMLNRARRFELVHGSIAFCLTILSRTYVRRLLHETTHPQGSLCIILQQVDGRVLLYE